MVDASLHAYKNDMRTTKHTLKAGNTRTPPVVYFLVVHVAVGDDVLNDTPVEGALGHVLAPVLSQ